MALSFGLSTKPGAASKAPAKSAKKASIFDDDFDEEIGQDNQDVGQNITDFDGTPCLSSTSQNQRPKAAGTKPKSKPSTGPPTLKGKAQRVEYGDLSGNRASNKHATAAEELDSSVWDYDSFHDAQTSVTTARKAAAKQDAIERKPKYMDNLLDAAARRKQDLLVAREKLLQKEREAEGDELADKEKFVTNAYKAQQEEARRIEADEQKKAEEEEKRRNAGTGGMRGFYKGMMAENEKKHQEAMEVAQKLEQGVRLPVEEAEKTKTDAELAEELKAKGINVYVNEEGQVADKRQLLSAGLNIAPSGTASQGSADHLKTQSRPAQQYQGRNRNDQRATRERQTRMMEEQLAESTKRAADEEAEDLRKREHAAKSRKTDTDISSAKERYLARKREAEAAKKAG